MQTVAFWKASRTTKSQGDCESFKLWLTPLSVDEVFDLLTLSPPARPCCKGNVEKSENCNGLEAVVYPDETISYLAEELMISVPYVGLS